MNKNITIDKILMGFIQKEKKEKVKKYEILNKYVKKNQTLFVGSSLMEYFPINELLQSFENHSIIYNRGVAGFVTDELLEVMNQCIFDLEPSKIFINIGTNDIGSFHEPYNEEKLIKNYDNILCQIKNKLPETKVYVMKYYPANPDEIFEGIDVETHKMLFKSRKNETIENANSKIAKLAKKYQYEFIDVNNGLIDEKGNLKKEFSMDGIHMFANGYEIVYKNLLKFL